MKPLKSRIEITAPVGSWESLVAAIQAGADSVYFGIGILNMRARSSINFTIRDLVKIAGICRKNNVQSYLTLSTVIYDGEMKEMYHYHVNNQYPYSIGCYRGTPIALPKQLQI